MTLSFDHLPALDSPLRRRDPRCNLAAFAVAVVVTSFLQTIPGAAAAWLAALVLVVIGQVPWRWYLKRLRLLVPFFLLFGLFLPFLVRDPEPLAALGPLTISARGIRAAALIGFKGIAIVTFVLVLLTTAPLHVILQAAHALRVPGLVVQVTLLAYRYVFLLTEELERLRTAVRVRAFRAQASLHGYRTVAHVAGALLVRSHDRAERIAQAMRCRGFDGRFRSLADFRTTAADWWTLVFFAGLGLGLLATDVWLR